MIPELKVKIVEQKAGLWVAMDELNVILAQGTDFGSASARSERVLRKRKEKIL